MYLALELMGEEHFERRLLEIRRRIDFRMIAQQCLGAKIGCIKTRNIIDSENHTVADSLCSLIGDEQFWRYMKERNQRTCFVTLKKRFTETQKILYTLDDANIDNIACIENRHRLSIGQTEYHEMTEQLYTYYFNHISLLKILDVANSKECAICCQDKKKFAILMCCGQIDTYCINCIKKFKKCPICKRSFHKEIELISWQVDAGDEFRYHFSREQYMAQKAQRP